MPGPASNKEKACIVAETRQTMILGDPDYCVGTLPGDGTYPACIQVTTTFIDFDDPVMIRD